jgi:signal transduction histidine kinase
VTNTASSPSAEKAAEISRAEFEQFLHVYTHEIRNRLNAIALEAADLAEQDGGQADASRLQRHVQECSAFLKKVRDTLAPDNPQTGKIALADFVKQLKERKSGEK